MRTSSTFLPILAALCSLSSAVPTKRDIPHDNGVTCDTDADGHNILLQRLDSFAARDKFKLACDADENGNPHGSTITRISNDVVAYFCVLKGTPVCSSKVFIESLRKIVSRCPHDADFFGDENFPAGSWTDKYGDYMYGFGNRTVHSYCQFPAGSSDEVGGNPTPADYTPRTVEPVGFIPIGGIGEISANIDEDF